MIKLGQLIWLFLYNIYDMYFSIKTLTNFLVHAPNTMKYLLCYGFFLFANLTPVNTRAYHVITHIGLNDSESH